MLRPVQACMKVNMNFKWQKQKYYKKRKKKNQGLESRDPPAGAGADSADGIGMLCQSRFNTLRRTKKN